MMSRTAQEIVLDGKGYRTETFRGSRVRELKKVLKYEMMELENIDIPETMFLLYNDFSLPSMDIYSGDHYTEAMASCDIDEDLIKLIVKDIIKYVSEKLGKNKSEIEVLWLSTLKNVKKNYCDDSGYSDGFLFHNYYIDRYELKEPYMIISDLDEDGILVAF